MQNNRLLGFPPATFRKKKKRTFNIETDLATTRMCTTNVGSAYGKNNLEKQQKHSLPLKGLCHFRQLKKKRKKHLVQIPGRGNIASGRY